MPIPLFFKNTHKAPWAEICFYRINRQSSTRHRNDKGVLIAWIPAFLKWSHSQKSSIEFHAVSTKILQHFCHNKNETQISHKNISFPIAKTALSTNNNAGGTKALNFNLYCMSILTKIAWNWHQIRPKAQQNRRSKIAPVPVIWVLTKFQNVHYKRHSG